MNKTLFPFYFLSFAFGALFAQTKVSGIVVDKMNQPVPFAQWF
jgi:hypothetical protein